MPYISQKDRLRLNDLISQLDQQVHGYGDLNYVITCLCQMYIKRHGLNYGNLNGVMGVLECSKQELCRTVISKYEDFKIQTNGDIEILSNDE